MCRIGFSHVMCQRSSTAGWCDRPMPSTRRPWVRAWAVSALAASAMGCWVHVGTTAVPSSITLVAGPAAVSTPSASASPVWASQYDEKPSASAVTMSVVMVPTSGRARSDEPLMPMRMAPYDPTAS
jgi:hypothetical protein